VSIIAGHADDAVGRAQEVIGTLDQLLEDKGSRRQIMEAIKKYERDVRRK